MDEQTQQQLTVTAAAQAGLGPAELWIAYYAMGGSLSQVEVKAYLLGEQGIPQLEGDILALTLNEILPDTASELRVPYSTDGQGMNTDSTSSAGDGTPEAAGIDEAGDILERALEDLGAAGTSFLTPTQAEAERLRAVERTGLVDTPAEERFDRITRQAKEHFGVSSASVALIAKQRQFLKSVIGPLGQNTPRDIALCSETIRRAGPMIINDTLNDPLFKNNPLVTGEPRIRFYAGYPLIGSGGWAVGTLCIIDQNPRDFTVEDQQVLRDLAEDAQREIDD
ncbi:GAF domain-containing protein [Arthrobacter zhaoguopingii]|uniref:GAF domain-containing protein n=1 Tax=Arthrobacter zhaoguopingii TaxID=2681491 RepID=UPI00135C6831|nr:GAF domain-containing protein [Arthrobacter zhaoguopingii]